MRVSASWMIGVPTNPVPIRYPDSPGQLRQPIAERGVLRLGRDLEHDRHGVRGLRVRDHAAGRRDVLVRNAVRTSSAIAA